MNKKTRDLIKSKYNNKCAYCGIELPNRWHVDHIKPLRRDWINGGCLNPENDHIDNFNPSCPSCNIIKSSTSLDSFRRTIQGFVKSLNRDSTQYKFAKRYGLVVETEQEVKFYFETL